MESGIVVKESSECTKRSQGLCNVGSRTSRLSEVQLTAYEVAAWNVSVPCGDDVPGRATEAHPSQDSHHRLEPDLNYAVPPFRLVVIYGSLDSDRFPSSS